MIFRGNSYLCAVLARLLSTKMKNHSCKCLVIRYGNKSPIFFCSILKVKKLRYTVFERGDSSLRLLLFWRSHGSYIVSFPTFVLMLSKLSSGRNKSGYQYYSECWLESSEFIHKLTFAIYEKKQKVFQRPSFFVSLCYYISAAVDEKANILVQLAERFRSSLISLFSQYFIVEH